MSDLALSPFGLLLATVLCIANVFADVSRKKVVEGHDLVSATFWIRFFAAIVFTVPLVVYAALGSPTIIHPPAALVPGDLKNVDAFISHLMVTHDAKSGFFTTKLSAKGWAKLSGTAPLAPDETKAAILCKELNDNVLKSDMYAEKRALFNWIHLSDETLDIIDKQPKGEAANYANRLILDDAFPEYLIPKARDCAVFGSEQFRAPPLTAFLIYLAIDVAMISMAQLLLMLALQVSPMSMCIPFMAFTPVFLVPAEYIILGQTPIPIKLIGIGLIVVGSLVMQRQFFASGWLAPIKAIFKQRGSRYILLVAFILAITSPVERQLSLMSDPFTTAFSYGIGLCVFFGILAVVRRAPLGSILRKTPRWAVVAGFMDAVAILLLYFTFAYITVSITISIKRAGVIVAIFAGWLFFKERDLTDKLIAASVMLGGMLIFYLPLTLAQASALAVVTLIGMVVALVVTRRPVIAAVGSDAVVAEEVLYRRNRH